MYCINHRLILSPPVNCLCHFSCLMSVTVRPLEVYILFNNQPLSADRQYEVQCQTTGSRPPSIITWWMNGVALVAQPSKVSPSDTHINTSP